MNQEEIDALNEYQNNLNNFDNLKDTYTYYNNDNIDLMKKINSNDSNIATNFRKTYYQQEGISKLDFYYDVLFYIYTFVFFAIIISLFSSQSYFSVTTNLFILVILILYPYFSTIIFYYIMTLFSEVNDLIPTNIYTKI
jgi:hypothetical protein